MTASSKASASELIAKFNNSTASLKGATSTTVAASPTSTTSVPDESNNNKSSSKSSSIKKYKVRLVRGTSSASASSVGEEPPKKSSSPKSSSTSNIPLPAAAAAPEPSDNKGARFIKPSELKAIRQEEKRRKELIQQREDQAQKRMEKIKAEIKSIEQRESRREELKQELKQLEQETELAELAKNIQQEDEISIGDAVVDSIMALKDEGDGDNTRNLVRRNSKRKLLSEMHNSFDRLDFDPDADSDNEEKEDIDGNINAQNIHQLRARLRKTRPHRNNSLVPEMRRKASQRDLMFSVRENTHDKDKGDDSSSPSFEIIPKSSLDKQGAEEEESPSNGNKSPKENKERSKDDNKLLNKHREQLEKAKKDFQTGYDLCWKFQDSQGALEEFRKALFTRESLLGKYHEETGKTYYWIGRSLVKLQEYEEALIAFSRALRIFERVLRKNHKLIVWVRSSIDNVFQENDDICDLRSEYIAAIEASIAHEQNGDTLRKKGRSQEAISEYREAIDNLEEFHPDSADLYCKIAIVLRSQGEFDLALEEYQHASAIYETALGADHPETQKTMSNLSDNNKRLGQRSLALLEKLGNA